MKSFMVIIVVVLLGVAGYGGYYLGQKNQKSRDAKSSASGPSQVISQLPVVTPVETLRSFLGNFFFDNNFVSNGYQQSASLTPALISTLMNNQSQQISVPKSIFCSEAVPITVSFSPTPLTQFSTSAVVVSTEVYKTGPNIMPSYDLVLNNGRWQIDRVTCPH